MAYFPFFVDLEGQRGLIVGGGTVALRKAEKLLPYGPALTVVAPEPVSELAALPVELTRREFQPEDLDRAVSSSPPPTMRRRTTGYPPCARDEKFR